MSGTEASLWNEHLVEPSWLNQQLDRSVPDLVIVDMRGQVELQTSNSGEQSAEYRGAREEYAKSHIPGAVYVDWTSDIADTEDVIPVQVAESEKFERVLGVLGIGNGTSVIAYDSHPSMQFATRFWWACKYYGFNNVRVLHGGWKQWVDESRPVTTDVETRKPTPFTATRTPKWIASSRDVLAAIGDPHIQIIDARDAGQFSGHVRRGLRGGHIPGALHLPREAIFESHSRMKPPSELTGIIHHVGIRPLSTAKDDENAKIIAYCNGGVAATSVLFALSILGYTQLANYDGSWNEWNLDDSLPVESS